MVGGKRAVRRVGFLSALGVILAAGLGFLRLLLPGDISEGQARRFLSATGVSGGLIVHVGCGDGRLTAALRANSGCLVHGLDRDGATVQRARKHLQSLGLYGAVSVDRFDGQHLPYVEDLVKLLVLSPPCGLEKQEMLRVLAPGGVAVVLKSGDRLEIAEQWSKPWPAEIDQWSHFLHDAT